MKREGKLANGAVSAQTIVWCGFLSLLALPLVSFAATASIVTSPGQPTPPLEACFDLSSAFTTGVNQAVKVTVSAYNAEDTAVSFDRVQLMKQGKLVGMNVAAKTEALPRGNPVAFSFDNFGVSPEDLRGVDCVSITFLDHGGKNSTGLVTVKGIDVKVTRDEGDACVIVDPVIIQTPPKQPPLIVSVVNEGRVVNANASTSGGGGGSGGTPTSQGPSELQTKSDYCPSGCSGSWTEAAYWITSTAANSPSSYLWATGGGFNIPVGATITGVKLIIQKHGESNLGEEVFDNAVRLIKGGLISGNNKALMTAWPASDTNFTYGGAGDVWGLTLTPTDVNSASGFGAAINVTGGTTGSAYILSMNMTIYYTSGGGSIYDAFTDLIHALSNRLFCVITNSTSCAR